METHWKHILLLKSVHYWSRIYGNTFYYYNLSTIGPEYMETHFTLIIIPLFVQNIWKHILLL